MWYVLARGTHRYNETLLLKLDTDAWRWRSQQASFGSLRTETLLNTQIALYQPRSNGQAEHFFSNLSGEQLN